MENIFAGNMPGVEETRNRINRNGMSSAGRTPANAEEGRAIVPARRTLDEDYTSNSSDASETKRRVRPRIEKRITYHDGWCRERCESGNCWCFKARLYQLCQACKSQISEGHCIEKGNYGWTHVRCRGDELRENQVSLTNAFVPQAPARAALEGASTLPQLMNDETNVHDDEDEDEEEGSGGDTETDTGVDDERDSKPSAMNIVTQDSSDDEEDDDDWLTDEQKRIVKYEPSPGSLIRIDALAGCGKTTTCAFISHESNERLGRHCTQLYVVFNSTAETEAKNSHKFPKNVQIMTSHALAKRKLFGTHPFVIAKGGLNKNAVIDHLDLVNWIGDKFPRVDAKKAEKIANTIARFVIKTVEIFQHSADTGIAEGHVWWQATVASQTERSNWKEKVSKARYVAWAQSIFDLISMQCEYQAGKSREEPRPCVGITFDGYVKYLQLHRDEYGFNYDVVMVDEAQDMTPCQADLLWGSSITDAAAVYLVGDENQRLYRFRGAKDSFEATKVTKSFPLSGSFRFGRNIGAAASQVLAVSTEARVQGFSADKGKIYGSSMIFEGGAVICRTRNGMLRYLETHRPKKWTFLSNSQKLPNCSRTLEPLEEFYLGKKAPHRYRQEAFSSWEDLREFAEEEGDSDMMNNLSLIEDFHARNKGTSICTTFEDVSQNWVHNWRKEQTDKGIGIPDINDFDGIVMATCHGAKGLEFDNVYIHDDFSFDTLMKIEEFVSSQHLKEMLNLIYVAITRAKRALYLSSAAEAFLRWAKERYNIDSDSGDDDEGTEKAHGGNDVSEDDLRQARENLDLEWRLFLTRRNAVNSIRDIPKPTGPQGNEFALCSSMTIAEQRSFIKTYMLRYNKFFPSFGNRIQLENHELHTLGETINGWCCICNTLWSVLREQDGAD